MKWTRGTKNDDVVDVRGAGGASGGGLSGGAKLGGGSVVTLLIIFVIAKATGVDVSSLLGGSTTTTSQPTPKPTGPTPPVGLDPHAEDVDYIRFVMKDIQDAFEAKFAAAGKPYPRAKLYVFANSIDTACGRSSSAIGPFYCPGDAQAYIDLSFFRELSDRFGAPGRFAQAYVLAHEIGHHVQNLLDADAQAAHLVKGNGGGKAAKNAASVRIELQADCYAGVWGNAAKGKKLLEVDDLESAIVAAQAIGDDRLQKQAGVDVNSETWTHGSSAQRVKWFRRGFDSGSLDACDTFSVESP
ncbi:MAG: neutral zinc metallopeptidase [Proteobacteria bacterium]|nr:neutral zinc metallopeptidase [Pseudomonadota bacterium]